MDKTFIMVKPDAIRRNLLHEILDELKKEQFDIVRSGYIKVNEPLILSHYEDVIKSLNIDYFKDAVIRCFNNETVWIAELKSTHDPIRRLRTLIGATDPKKAEPHTIRGKYGVDSFEEATKEKRMIDNLVHASDSMKAVQKELELWFETYKHLRSDI